MNGKRHVILLAVLAVALLILPATMQAGTNLGLQLVSNPDTATICDNNINFPGCTGNASDINPALGQITFMGPVGGWTTNVTSGFGPPYLIFAPFLDISTFNATSTAGAGPMTILLSVVGLTSPSFAEAFNMIGGTSSYAGAVVTSQIWYSASNAAFCASTACGTAISSLLTVSGAAFSGHVDIAAPLGSGPFSLTMAVTINADGQVDTTSFDDEFSLPEPATLSVLGSGLLGFGMAFRKMLLRA
jgi:hypothetical protein